MTFSGNVDHVKRSRRFNFGDVQICIQECFKHTDSSKHHSGRQKEEKRMLIIEEEALRKSYRSNGTSQDTSDLMQKHDHTANMVIKGSEGL